MGAFDQRPRFYEGQFLAAADLDAAIQYPRAALARHALGGHTWGIALGLSLGERAAPGAPGRVELILHPGLAWDGFGRHIVVDRPQRIAETLCADVPFTPALDLPAVAAAAPAKGRLLKLWIGYDEQALGAPAPGFQACSDGAQQPRVQEGFRLFVGDVGPAQRRAGIIVGTESMDARNALAAFDQDAGPLWDASVPHQALPLLAARPPRWLVPLGLVRWIARDGELGYYARLGLDPTDNAADRARAQRRYVGVVAQNIEAADGAVVVHRRDESPLAAHRLAQLLAAGGKWKDLQRDLLWVEGNARVVGDATLAGGALLLRNGDGFEEGTPLLIARHGDGTAQRGNRELCAVIGPSSQTDNRFVVGPQRSKASPPDIAPRLVVTSGAGAAPGDAQGRVGVNTRDPEQALHVVGERIRLSDAAVPATRAVELGTDGGDMALVSDTSSLRIRARGNANRLLLNPMPDDGPVGVGTEAPQYGLDVKKASLRFDLSQQNTSGQLVLCGDPTGLAGRVVFGAADAGGNNPAWELRFAGHDGWTPLPMTRLRTEVLQLSGRLEVEGDSLSVQGNGNKQAYLDANGTGNNDVQLGSRNSKVDTVALWNPGAQQLMNLQCHTVQEMSDERAKTDVRPLEGALDKVARLRGVSFCWRAEAVETAVAGLAPRQRLGLIAQEVQQVVPEAVTVGPRGAGLSYSALVPVLVEALKELQGQVQALRAEVEALKRPAGKGSGKRVTPP